MSTLVNISRQPDSLQAYQLTTPEDMVAALAYLAGGGYTGHINCSSENGTPVWAMGLSSPNQNTSTSARIGDWIVVKNNVSASVVPADQFASLYTVQ